MNDRIWNDAIEKIIFRLLEKPDVFAQEQTHLCPICRDRLNIRIDKYQRSNTKMIGASIECARCDKAMAVDFIEG